VQSAAEKLRKEAAAAGNFGRGTKRRLEASRATPQAPAPFIFPFITSFFSLCYHSYTNEGAIANSLVEMGVRLCSFDLILEIFAVVVVFYLSDVVSQFNELMRNRISFSLLLFSAFCLFFLLIYENVAMTILFIIR
jgi:cell division protein FtsW (lipid II flippase)